MTARASRGSAASGPGGSDGTGRSRPGRRAGASGTREAILASARHLFAARGYEGATIRAIAADADVDPALVHHFYGTKERLFAAAMRLPAVPSEVISGAMAAGARPAGRSMGEHMVATALTLWESPGVLDPFLGLLRTAVTSEQAAGMLREFLTDAILGPMAAVAARSDPEGAEFRAAMIATQMVGLMTMRYVLQLGPVASASIAQLAAAIGPTIDRYLTGDVRTPPS
jgi:AcrR family transcriptional regulator